MVYISVSAVFIASDSAREPRPLMGVYLLSAVFVRHFNLMNSFL